MHVETCRRDHTSAELFKLEKLVLQAQKFLMYDKKNNYIGHNMSYFVIRPQLS